MNNRIYHILLIVFLTYPLAICAADKNFSLDSLVFKRVDTGGGPANSHIVHILQARDGRMIVTSSGYVDIYDGARFRHLAVADNVESALSGCDMPYTVYADNHDRVWFKQWGKYKCLNLRTERFITNIDSIYSHHGINGQVLDVLCDDNSEMWVRTGDALVNLDNPKRRIALADTLNVVHDMHIVGNRLYLFFNTCEIQCYDLKTLRLQYTCTPLKDGEGRGYSSQTSIVVPDGNRIYMFKSGSEGGVCYRFDISNRSFKEIMHRDHGFHGVSLQSGRRIFIASRDCVWSLSLADESITRYEQFNLQGELFGFRHFNWIYVDRQDGVWLCSYNDGIFYAHAANQQSYDADGVGTNPVPAVSPLNVMLVGMSVNGVRQKTGGGILKESEAYIKDIDLDYSDRNVIVEISALNYALPNNTLYYYKLVGDGEDADGQEWSEATRDNYMIDSNGLLILPLQNLAPGAYSLIVKAQCGEASHTATFRLNVGAPWWLTPIAFVIYFIVAVAVIVGLSSLMTLYSRRKMERRRKEERLLMQIHSLIDRCNEYEKAIAETTGKDSKAFSGDESGTCIVGDENGTGIADETDDNQLSEADSEFLRRAIELVERNVSTNGYSVEQLSTDLCMERSGLYKKMTAIMEKTPSAFIRSIRMQKAAGLLKTGKYTVSDVALRTGFSSTSHFCRVFQSEYGCTPGEYIKTDFSTFVQ